MLRNILPSDMVTVPVFDGTDELKKSRCGATKASQLLQHFLQILPSALKKCVGHIDWI